MRCLTAATSVRRSWPSTWTVPASGRRSPSIISTVVVLPAPLGPSRPKISPASTAIDTPSTARMSP